MRETEVQPQVIEGHEECTHRYVRHNNIPIDVIHELMVLLLWSHLWLHVVVG